MTSIDLSDVFAYVEANQQQFIERLIDYVRRPSISAHGLGIAEVADFLVSLLSGPAANLTGEINNNGIRATADGHTLVVAHSGDGVLNTVDPVSGASSTIAGVSVPNVDGILLEGRTVYAVLNFTNEIVQISLDGRLESGTRVKTITSPAFQVPTTVARFGDRLATVNAKFDTGLPPTADTYEVVVVDR